MKTKTENIAGACVYSTRIESNLRHNIILSFSQSRSQLLLSFWSAPRITNHFRWISVTQSTQALGTGLSFSNVFVWTVENASEPTSVHANRSMRFRWQRKRILSKRISVNRTEIWSFQGKTIQKNQTYLRQVFYLHFSSSAWGKRGRLSVKRVAKRTKWRDKN